MVENIFIYREKFCGYVEAYIRRHAGEISLPGEPFQ